MVEGQAPFCGWRGGFGGRKMGDSHATKMDRDRAEDGKSIGDGEGQVR